MEPNKQKRKNDESQNDTENKKHHSELDFSKSGFTAESTLSSSPDLNNSEEFEKFVDKHLEESILEDASDEVSDTFMKTIVSAVEKEEETSVNLKDLIMFLKRDLQDQKLEKEKVTKKNEELERRLSDLRKEN